LNPRVAPRLVILCLVLATALASCNSEPEWTEDQTAVHKAMMDWSMAVSRRDGAELWDNLSPDAQDIFRRELEGTSPPGVRVTVKMYQASLSPDARTPESERQRIKGELAKLPPDPDKMTAKDYYIWRITPDLTAEGAERTASLFAKGNISQIEVEGDRATVILKNGTPDRYSWFRHDGVWKNDIKPSILRALEEARSKESKQE